jgi:hypothetical protein
MHDIAWQLTKSASGKSAEGMKRAISQYHSEYNRIVCHGIDS